jgi:hypothetical protein
LLFFISLLYFFLEVTKMKKSDINGKLLYQNHYQMKQNRLIKLMQTKGKCEICGKKANTIHHKDETMDNHSLENLIVLCVSCHRMVHNAGYKDNHTSKFIRLYGATIEEIAVKLKIHPGSCYKLHKNNRLQTAIELWANKNPQHKISRYTKSQEII